MSNQNTVIALGYAQTEVSRAYDLDMDHNVVGWYESDIVLDLRNRAVEVYTSIDGNFASGGA